MSKLIRFLFYQKNRQRKFIWYIVYTYIGERCKITLGVTLECFPAFRTLKICTKHSVWILNNLQKNPKRSISLSIKSNDTPPGIPSGRRRALKTSRKNIYFGITFIKHFSTFFILFSSINRNSQAKNC